MFDFYFVSNLFFYHRGTHIIWHFTEALTCCHIVLSLSRRKKQTCCVLSCAFREDSANNVVVGDSQSAATVLVDQLVLRMLNILQHGL